MKIESVFKNDIHRVINGVIKVEQHDTEVVFHELSEYVLTREVENHFINLIRAYNRCLDGPTDRIGVWISGFFGSGKSHFLKMLSYLMQNIDVEGLKALQFFREKIQDPLAVGDIERAVSTGSVDVILFNIDSKSDNRMHGTQDAIVQVFMKAFNGHLGYCAEIPWLAELERQMEDRKQYEDFKAKYHEITGNPWHEGRESFHFDRDNIIKVLSETSSMSEESAAKWFDAGEANYAISVEKFAKIVKAYCEKKGRGHRVLFLVDEVGQYIGDSRELMLNLQTVVEDLGLSLKGRAWVMVTSQEAIDSITVIKGDDFSKIRGRFSTNISLSNDNTDEVIKKRLLQKNETAEQHLKAYWADINSTVKNLFTFSAGTAEMKPFKTREDFVEVYPFVPYQFNLLQKVFEQIRRIGATGAHLSAGERSMLSAFQDAAKVVASNETGHLVPFHYFYSSIEAFLHGGIKRTISQARTNSNLKEVDCDLLKTLFMIKYIKEIRPNLENLTTLSLSSISQDKLSLRKSIQASLNRLVAETLVHKNGEEYEFLTNEEQDITRKIKAVNIEQEQVINHVGDVFISEIYPETRVKLGPDNDYGINKQIDSINKGSQTSELTLKVITPWCDDPMAGVGQMAFTSMNNMVLVKLPDDQSYLNEIKEMLQIERFNSRESTSTNSETIRNIINEKGRLAAKMKTRIVATIKEAVCDSEFTIMGQREDIRRSEARVMINAALGKLAENVYPKREYIKEHCRYLDDIKALLEKDDLALFNESEKGANREAWKEIMDHLQIQSQRMMAVTVKTIQEKFMKSPYGWSEMDLGGLLAGLYANGRVKFKFNGEFVKNNKELPGYLTSKKFTEKVQVEPRAEIDEAILTRARKVITEAFGTSNLPEGAEGLYKAAVNLLSREEETLKGFVERYRIQPAYPGKSVADKGLSILLKLLKIEDESAFFNSLASAKDDLVDTNEDLREVSSFFENQADIFDRAARGITRFKSDIEFMDADCKGAFEQIETIVSMERPYSRIKDLPELGKKIEDLLQKRLSELRIDMIENVKRLEEKARSEMGKVTLDKGVIEKIEGILSNLMKGIGPIDECHRMAAYHLKINSAREAIYRTIDDEAVCKTEPEPVPTGGETEPVTGGGDKTPRGGKLKKKTVSFDLKTYSGVKISCHEDFEKLVHTMKRDIMDHLENGNDVRLM